MPRLLLSRCLPSYLFYTWTWAESASCNILPFSLVTTFTTIWLHSVCFLNPPRECWGARDPTDRARPRPPLWHPEVQSMDRPSGEPIFSFIGALCIQCIRLQLAELLEGRWVISDLGTSPWGALGRDAGGTPTWGLGLLCLFYCLLYVCFIVVWLLYMLLW